MSVSISTSRSLSTRRVSWAWLLAGATCVLFGVMAMEFNFALRADSANWWAQLQASVTGETYSLGPASAHAMYPTYRESLTAMSSHTALGGAALTLAVLQFIPALRRRYRLAHRLAGGLVMLGVGASMVGALSYLARTPLADIYASPGFGLALWALALACLAYLSLAVLALRRRDYRSHMGFMALMMGTLLTAPVLRIEWALFGITGAYDMDEVNQGVVASLAVLCNLIMALWMHHVGAGDLPARRRASVPTAPLLKFFGYGASAVIVHEGLLAPNGIDLIAAWRAAGESLPAVAAVWALPAAWLAATAPREIARVVAGHTLSRLSYTLLVVTGLTALLIAVLHAEAAVDSVGLRFYWAAYGLVTLALLLAARFSTRADEPWTLLVLFLTLAPVLWPALWLVAWLCAQSFTVAMWFAATVALAAMSANGFITAFGVRLPIGKAA